MVESLIRSSLGRTARLGDYYDVRTDQLILGMNIFNDDVEKFITPLPNSKHFIKQIFESSTTKKLDELKIGVKAKLSILSGMAAEASGAVDFIKTKKIKTNECQCHFIARVSTVDESINICNKNLRDFIDIQDMATHVIVKITYGANATASLRYEANDEEERISAKAKIKGGIEKFKTIAEARAGINGRYEDSEFSSLKNFTFELNADVTPNEQTSTDLTEILKIIYGLPQRMAENKKGSQLEFGLLSVDTVKNFLRRFYIFDFHL